MDSTPMRAGQEAWDAVRAHLEATGRGPGRGVVGRVRVHRAGSPLDGATGTVRAPIFVAGASRDPASYAVRLDAAGPDPRDVRVFRPDELEPLP